MIEEEYKILVDESMSLVDALKVLNETGKRIVFLVKNRRLVGALTYGDVSRWILKGNSLEVPSKDAANLDPIYIFEENINEADRYFSDASSLFSGRQLLALPVLNSDGDVVDILFQEKENRKFGKIDLPVVIMAGGKGTRLYPYTKILPKPLIPIGDIPIAEHIVNRFYTNGCRQFYFIVNYKKNMIKAYFNEIDRDYEVQFIDEDIPLGTGGGLCLVKNIINSTFILTNCDSFIDEDYSKIVKVHKDRRNLVTLICSDQRFEVPYGVIETDESGMLLSMKEKPNLSYLTNTGSYIVEPEVIEIIEPNIPIGFPDIIQKVKDLGGNIGIYTVPGKDWLDMGQFDSMDEMKKRLNIKD